MVTFTSISTGLAGYTTQDKNSVPFFIVPILVAISGSVASVRDAWRVNQELDDTNQRYLDVRALITLSENTRFEADGKSRDDEKSVYVRSAARNIRQKMENIKSQLDLSQALLSEKPTKPYPPISSHHKWWNS